MPLVLCILLTFLTNIGYSSSRSCLSFNNTSMLLYDRHGKKFNQDVNGCITRTEFGNTTVIKAYVKDQIVPELARDSIRHMKYLTIVSFNNCYVEEIKPVAFRNVPSLVTIEMTFNKLKTIPKGVFNSVLTPQLELLKIDHNKIDLIEDQAFHNMSSLKNIQLNNNNLESFRTEWFENTTLLEIMNFSFNNITEIPRRAFINFYNLKKLYFDNNAITTIQEDAFKGPRTLVYLGLGHNQLTVLNDVGFPNTIRIDYLAINANSLTFLSDGIFKKLAVVEINMDYNPWTCPCLERINYWLYLKNGRIKRLDECSGSDVPACVVPKNTDSCTYQFDHEAVLRYTNAIKDINMSTPIPVSCINLQ